MGNFLFNFAIIFIVTIFTIYNILKIERDEIKNNEEQSSWFRATVAIINIYMQRYVYKYTHITQI